MLPEPLLREGRGEGLVRPRRAEPNRGPAASVVSPRLWIGIVVALPPTVFLWWLLLYGVWNPFT